MNGYALPASRLTIYLGGVEVTLDLRQLELDGKLTIDAMGVAHAHVEWMGVGA